MPIREFNFDGIVGPTHNYSGLSYGNVASKTHQHQASSPKAAALQGLEKMKYLADLGVGQAVLPPLLRPRLDLLRQLGFSGTDAQIVESAYEKEPVLLAASYSASNMWTANAATVSPSLDCEDNRLHFTPANLASTLHRSIEPDSTARVLGAIFSDSELFQVHPPLPSTSVLADEGAANHTRLAPTHHETGLEVFVYGHAPMSSNLIRPSKFPARQTLEACQAICRRHRLRPDTYQLLQQTPAAIDEGVFHNDVISVGNQNVLLCHENAFVDQAEALDELKKRYARMFDSRLYIIQFSSKEISLSDAVRSYLFNSQLVTRPDGPMTLICPADCQENRAANRCIERLVAEDNPVDRVEFFDLRQSMNNGGGPACLRLRVVLTEEQQERMHQGVILTDALYSNLVQWVTRHYREELRPEDLRDPELIEQVSRASEELVEILNLPSGILSDP